MQEHRLAEHVASAASAAEKAGQRVTCVEKVLEGTLSSISEAWEQCLSAHNQLRHKLQHLEQATAQDERARDASEEEQDDAATKEDLHRLEMKFQVLESSVLQSMDLLFPDIKNRSTLSQSILAHINGRSTDDDSPIQSSDPQVLQIRLRNRSFNNLRHPADSFSNTSLSYSRTSLDSPSLEATKCAEASIQNTSGILHTQATPYNANDYQKFNNSLVFLPPTVHRTPFHNTSYIPSISDVEAWELVGTPEQNIDFTPTQSTSTTTGHTSISDFNNIDNYSKEHTPNTTASITNPSNDETVTANRNTVPPSLSEPVTYPLTGSSNTSADEHYAIPTRRQNAANISPTAHSIAVTAVSQPQNSSRDQPQGANVTTHASEASTIQENNRFSNVVFTFPSPTEDEAPPLPQKQNRLSTSATKTPVTHSSSTIQTTPGEVSSVQKSIPVITPQPLQSILANQSSSSSLTLTHRTPISPSAVNSFRQKDQEHSSSHANQLSNDNPGSQADPQPQIPPHPHQLSTSTIGEQQSTTPSCPSSPHDVDLRSQEGQRHEEESGSPEIASSAVTNGHEYCYIDMQDRTRNIIAWDNERERKEKENPPTLPPRNEIPNTLYTTNKSSKTNAQEEKGSTLKKVAKSSKKKTENENSKGIHFTTYVGHVLRNWNN